MIAIAQAQIQPPTLEQARALTGALNRETEPDTLTSARWRVNVTFEAFYDDEPGEPDQAIRDVLTDLIHEARARGVDVDDAIRRATEMADLERADWTER